MGMLDIIRGALKGKRAKTPATPPGQVIFAEAEQDSPDMFPEPGRPSDPKIDGLILGIQYRDRHGFQSERVIRCRELMQRPDGLLLRAFCGLRQAERLFNLAGIKRISEYRTGAVHENPTEFILNLVRRGEHEPIHGETPELAGTASLLNLIRDELKVMLYIIESDEDFHSEERALLMQYVTERAAAAGMAKEDYQLPRIMHWLRTQYPDRQTIRASVERISRDGEEALLDLWEWCQNLAYADGGIRPDEVQALNELYNTIDDVVAEMRRGLAHGVR